MLTVDIQEIDRASHAEHTSFSTVRVYSGRGTVTLFFHNENHVITAGAITELINAAAKK